MYRLRPGIKKHPEKRWALPDRVFFACGACHILAYAFLRRFPDRGFRALWIRPAQGFTGNHIIVANGDLLHRPGPRFIDGVTELCAELARARARIRP